MILRNYQESKVKCKKKIKTIKNLKKLRSKQFLETKNPRSKSPEDNSKYVHSVGVDSLLEPQVNIQLSSH